MLRTTLTLEVLDFPDCDKLADPFYETNPVTGSLAAWYRPTPGLLSWFTKTIHNARRSKLSAKQAVEVERMAKTLAELTNLFPIGTAKPEVPQGCEPEDLIAKMNFVDSQRELLATGPKKDRTILAWRPVSETALREAIAESQRDKHIV